MCGAGVAKLAHAALATKRFAAVFVSQQPRLLTSAFGLLGKPSSDSKSSDIRLKAEVKVRHFW